MRYPFQKHFLVCTGERCRGDLIRDELKQHNKKMGRKPTVRVCSVSCLDLCDYGPNMIVDNIVYSHLDLDRARAVYDGVMGDGPERPDLELKEEELKNRA